MNRVVLSVLALPLLALSSVAHARPSSVSNSKNKPLVVKAAPVSHAAPAGKRTMSLRPTSSSSGADLLYSLARWNPAFAFAEMYMRAANNYMAVAFTMVNPLGYGARPGLSALTPFY